MKSNAHRRVMFSVFAIVLMLAVTFGTFANYLEDVDATGNGTASSPYDVLEGTKSSFDGKTVYVYRGCVVNINLGAVSMSAEFNGPSCLEYKTSNLLFGTIPGTIDFVGHEVIGLMNSNVIFRMEIISVERQTLVSNISISGPDEIALGDTATFTATTSPSNATDRHVDWSMSSTDYSTIQSQSDTSTGGTVTISADAVGTFTLYADSSDSGSARASIQISVYVPTFTVTLDHTALSDMGVDASGVEPKEQTVPVGESIFLLQIDSIQGYTHVGWTIDDVFYAVGSSYTPTGNITIRSVWQVPTVTMTFVSDGSTYATLSVPKGSTGIVFTPENVSGIFTGWFYDPGFQEEYDPLQPIDSDIRLYAKGVPPLEFTTDPVADGHIEAISG